MENEHRQRKGGEERGKKTKKKTSRKMDDLRKNGRKYWQRGNKQRRRGYIQIKKRNR